MYYVVSPTVRQVGCTLLIFPTVN